MGSGVVTAPDDFKEGDWMCKCGNHNYKSRAACGKCQTPRAMGAAVAAPANFKAGDWMCAKCGNHNYGSRAACGKCQSPKAMADAALMGGMAMGGQMGQMGAGASASTSMGPSFRTGDWMCKCGNHNYA